MHLYKTLVHLVKTAEVETGAGTATVTRELANRINEDAAPQDRVSGEALRQRTLEKSGEKNRICSNGTNKPESQTCPTCKSVYPGDHTHCPAVFPNAENSLISMGFISHLNLTTF